MAEALKDSYGAAIPKQIAGMISNVYPAFKQKAFIKDVLQGYAPLALMPRGWKIARTLRHHLPQNYTAAVDILIASLGEPLDKTGNNGMAPFLYLPHGFFVAEFGLDDFEPSMRAQYELTQRFTSEFSIRPFLEHHPKATLARLKQWTKDPNVHVRRLVSEGTRSRLPWAPRLRAFEQDPRPVLALLELLKDDPELYVRRSVANNLNDIGKDHPALLIDTASRWLNNASDNRQRLVKHALRTAVKRAEPAALNLLGFGNKAKVAVENTRITPARPKMGGSIKIAFDLVNTAARKQRVLVDFRIHFIKANGRSSPKVFKLKTIELAAHATQHMTKTVSLAAMTTRKHYPGIHAVDVILNGQTIPLGTFKLLQ